MSVNKVILVGRLGKDPEPVQGHELVKFTVATSENWIDKQGQKQERTEWHNIEVWGARAKACRSYIKKGSQVYVEGKLQTRKTELDGVAKYFTSIKADKVDFLSGMTQKMNGEPFENQKQMNTTNDDLPF